MRMYAIILVLMCTLYVCIDMLNVRARDVCMYVPARALRILRRNCGIGT